MKRSLYMLLIAAGLLHTQAAWAQFPDSAEAQRRYVEEAVAKAKAEKEKAEKKKAAKQEMADAPASAPKANQAVPAQDPRSAQDPRAAQPVSAKPEPAKDPRNAAPSSAYPAQEKPVEKERKKLAVCSVAVPKQCSDALATANRACASTASRCARTPSITEDQSCAVMRCDVEKAVCMRLALDSYVVCMNDGLKGGGAEMVGEGG